MYKRILIFGHAGRGKSTFAKNLSNKLNIPFYSTDDFFYRSKLSGVVSKEESVENIKRVYEKDEWIMEGTTSRLIRPGVERADVIFILQFRNILPQYLYIIKRYLRDKDHTFSGTYELLRHVTKKKYVKGYGSSLPTKEELEKMNKKVIELYTLKDIDNYFKNNF